MASANGVGGLHTHRDFVAVEQLLLLLLRHHAMQRDELMLRDVDEELGFAEVLNHVFVSDARAVSASDARASLRTLDQLDRRRGHVAEVDEQSDLDLLAVQNLDEAARSAAPA